MEHHSQSADPLRNLSEHEIRLLRECYSRGLPGTLAPYLFIDNHLKWCDKIRNVSVDGSSTDEWTIAASLRLQFYTLLDADLKDLTTTGTFVAVTEAEKNPVVTFWTLREDLSQLQSALFETAWIDWRKDPAFSCVALEHYSMLQAVVQKKAPHLEFRNSTFFRLPREEAKKMLVSVPEGYEILPLDAKHAHLINATWPHRYEGSEHYYRSLLQLNGGLALVTGEKRDQLAGWVLTNEYGAVAHLYIQPDHRQRGLASVLVKAWVTQMVATWEMTGDEIEGSEVIAYILDVNHASRTLFQKLGFIEMSKSRWSNPTNKVH